MTDAYDIPNDDYQAEKTLEDQHSFNRSILNTPHIDFLCNEQVAESE